ncbi:hydroxymethylglutaryl-CoA lyase [Ilumatobacter nonamiensis]|uniref:hydroxymethylglutaryl-CoA lyase n=1 Tax=Ilumatobacter nonamiensis TaxID=467093 RepID=UPI00058CBECC|nr:hydroxymethylglutaryl-CoA lyase [Ilumatobacter nonamiensis]
MSTEATTAPPAERIEIVEVSARDGLQSESIIVSTDDKVELIRRAAASGLRRIEAVSFVNPKRVPQMADSAAVMSAIARPGVLPDRASVSIAGLVLNARGLQQAIDTGVDEINVVVVATDTFAERNQGKPTAGLVDVWHEVGAAARDAGLFTTVTIAAAFGCPFEGEVPPERLAEVIASVMATPPDEIALADSIGVAVPTDVRARVEMASETVSAAGGTISPELRCHFHNTRNTGLANAAAAAEVGVRVLDSSLGGIGGCPFAPNATGNIPTEDLVYLLDRMGYSTGVDLDGLCSIVPWIEEVVEHPAPGLLSKAGTFPAAS